MRTSRALGIVVAVMVLGASVFAVRPPSAPVFGEPLPGPEVTSPNRDGTVHHVVELVARDVDVSHLGIHTHANWVVFWLPFDVTDPGVKHVRFTPRATTNLDLGALTTPLGCLRVPASNSARWAKFTANGIGDTSTFDEHELVPTSSTRAYAMNVPTRLANAAACWRPSLTRPETWRLRVEWDGPTPAAP